MTASRGQTFPACRMYFFIILSFLLEQTCDLSVLVHIDLLGSRNFRKTRHRHDLAGQSHNKSSASGNLQVADSYFEICRSAQLGLSSVRLYCVFVTQIGHLSNPRAVSSAACFCAFAVRTTLFPPYTF